MYLVINTHKDVKIEECRTLEEANAIAEKILDEYRTNSDEGYPFDICDGSVKILKVIAESTYTEFGDDCAGALEMVPVPTKRDD